MKVDAIVLLSFKFVGDRMDHWLPNFGTEERKALQGLSQLFVAVAIEQSNGNSKVLGGVVAASTLIKSDPNLPGQLKLALEQSKFSCDAHSNATTLSIVPAVAQCPFDELDEQSLLSMAIHALTASGKGGSA